jgi:predicted dehydrogenase
MNASVQQRVRVGAIGCGQFMSRQHIPTIAHSPHLLLHHLADIDSGALDRLAASYHPSRRSTRWQDVVEDADVQIVVVGVLPELHPAIVRAALERGKPVYVEKPLAPTPQECLDVQRLAEQSGVPLAVGFNRRFAPATALLKAAFQRCQGPITLYYRMADDDRVRPRQQQWKKADRLGTEVVHIFDLAAYLFAAEPLSIYARRTRPNDDLVMVDYAGGSRAVILSSAYGSLAQPKEHLEAVLDRGTVEMDDFVEIRSYGVAGLPPLARFAGRAYDGCDNSHVRDFAERGLAALLDMRRRYAAALDDAGVLQDSPDPGAWDRARAKLGDPPLPQINYAADKGWGRALEEFCLAAIEGRTPLNANARDGNRATACAAAAHESIRTGLPVSLDPEGRLGR